MLIKIVGVIVALAVVAIVVVGAAMWRGIIPVPGPLLALVAGAKEPEHSARFYPADTLAYSWLTLTPGGGQFNDMRDIWERLNGYPAFADGLREFYTDFQDETGIDFEGEVASWVGPEIAGAVIAVDPGDAGAMPDDAEFWDGFDAAVTIGVRDKDAAAAFLVKWRSYMEKENDAEFAAGEYRGYDTWVDAGNYQAYALAGDWLVYATGEGTLQDILARIDGQGGPALADNANFVAARAALPERRFNSGYVDARQLANLADDFAAGALGTMGIGSVVGPTPEWAAASGAWVERGIVLEVVSPATEDFGFEVGNLANPARLLPDDTLAFLAAAFDPDVDNWRTALAKYPLADVLPPELLAEINAGLAEMSPAGTGLGDDATLADALDLGFGVAKDFTGVDLETDLFDHLAGEAILAVREFDFDAIDEDPENNPIEAVAMLSYRDDGKDGLQGTMNTVRGLIDDSLFFVAQSDTADVGGDADATVFRVVETKYAPGYVLHDGYLTLGSTESAMASVVGRQKGEGAALRDGAEYLRATGQLPQRERHFLGYVNLRSIIGQLDADELGMDADEYRILAEGLGAVAVGAISGEDYNRGALTLTLFPE